MFVCFSEIKWMNEIEAVEEDCGAYGMLHYSPLELHLAISELSFGQEWQGILLELLCSSSIV